MTEPALARRTIAFLVGHVRLVQWAARGLAVYNIATTPVRPFAFLSIFIVWVTLDIAPRMIAASRSNAAKSRSNDAAALGGAWEQTFVRSQTDRAEAEAAASILYRHAGLPPPEIRIWTRSVRELAIIEPVVKRFLTEFARGGSPVGSWTASVSELRPVIPNAAWDAAVSHVTTQMAAIFASGPVPGGSPEHIRILGSRLTAIDDGFRDSVRVAIWRTLRRLDVRAQANAYQLEREGYVAAAQGLLTDADSRDARMTELAAMEILAQTRRRAIGPEWAALGRLVRSSQSCLTLGGAMVFVEMPLAVHWDGHGQLHADNGPAMQSSDGFRVWAHVGIGMPAEAVESPTDLTIGLIRDAGRTNDARRQLLVNAYGIRRYIADGARSAEFIVGEPDRNLFLQMVQSHGEGSYAVATGRVMHRDVDGSGQARSLWVATRPGDEPLVVVDVANSTPEPDGSRRRYRLRVPPHITTCQDAVAWTFGIGGSEYHPVVET